MIQGSSVTGEAWSVSTVVWQDKQFIELAVRRLPEDKSLFPPGESTLGEMLKHVIEVQDERKRTVLDVCNQDHDTQICVSVVL